jgi:hypothetical protein
MERTGAARGSIEARAFGPEGTRGVPSSWCSINTATKRDFRDAATRARPASSLRTDTQQKRGRGATDPERLRVYPPYGSSTPPAAGAPSAAPSAIGRTGATRGMGHYRGRSPVETRPESLPYRPLIDCAYDRRGETNRDKIRRCRRCSPAWWNRRFRGAPGRGSPPKRRVEYGHAAHCAT